KLASTDGFVVHDLDDAEPAVGIVRLAPKILVDGATMLARSSTYEHAVFEQQVGGASAGINAKPDGRAAAIEAFVAEVAPAVSAGALCLDAGKGVAPSELGPLTEADRRPAAVRQHHDALRAASILATCRTAA